MKVEGGGNPRDQNKATIQAITETGQRFVYEILNSGNPQARRLSEKPNPMPVWQRPSNPPPVRHRPPGAKPVGGKETKTTPLSHRYQFSGACRGGCRQDSPDVAALQQLRFHPRNCPDIGKARSRACWKSQQTAPIVDLFVISRIDFIIFPGWCSRVPWVASRRSSGSRNVRGRDSSLDHQLHRKGFRRRFPSFTVGVNSTPSVGRGSA
jgi:hypothetical protein